MLAPRAEARFPPRRQREAVLLETGVLRVENAVGAVLLADLDHLVGDGVERLFPADRHKVAAARALLPHALHRVQTARLGVDLQFPRMAHRARAHLHVAFPDVFPAAVLAAVVLVDGIVGFDRDNLAVLLMAAQDARRVPAPVRRAAGVEDALSLAALLAGLDDGLFVHQLLLVFALV